MFLSTRQQALIVLFACLLFLLQALPHFGSRWVEDENHYASTGIHFMRAGEIRNTTFDPNLLESYDSRPLGMPVTLAASFRLLGVSPQAARMPGLFFCLGLIPIVYAIGRVLGSPAAGAMAALILSVDNSLFLAARLTRPEAGVAFFGGLAVLLYFLSWERQSTGIGILCGLAIGAAISYHVNGYGVALGIGLMLLGEFGVRVLWQKRAWAIVLTSIACLIPFYLWLRADPVHMQAFAQLYTATPKAAASNFWFHERLRYADYLGIGNQRIRFIPYALPLRLHIVLLFAFCLGVLARLRRDLFWKFLALIAASLFLWSRESNPTARFFVILAPYLALLTAFALTTVKSAQWRRVLVAWCVLAWVSQAGANFMLLRQSRQADYPALMRQLRTIVPPDARVYGAITFAMALNDRPAYYSWNHVNFARAIDDLGVNYLILNDRVLINGSGYGEDDWVHVRFATERFLSSGQAELVAHAPDPFYGDLQIYRVKPGAHATPDDDVTAGGYDGNLNPIGALTVKPPTHGPGGTPDYR